MANGLITVRLRYSNIDVFVRASSILGWIAWGGPDDGGYALSENFSGDSRSQALELIIREQTREEAAPPLRGNACTVTALAQLLAVCFSLPYPISLRPAFFCLSLCVCFYPYSTSAVSVLPHRVAAISLCCSSVYSTGYPTILEFSKYVVPGSGACLRLLRGAVLKSFLALLD